MSSTWSTWTRFLKRKGNGPFLELPEDVIVDEIISRLSVRDIVRLRRVNRALSVLTRKPIIWKRFIPYIAGMQQSLAPLPPTKQYNLKNITSYDAETIVTRAISYDWTWKSKKIWSCMYFRNLAWHHIEEMVLLPGGHFLVSSVRTYTHQYGILLWSLEHPANQLPAPLMFRHTEVKAYGLQAKYMMVHGSKGICVAFLRKFHKDREDRRPIPETFEMGGKADEEDVWMPLKYECTTLYVSFDAIEQLTDRHVEPNTSAFDNRMRQVANSLSGGNLWTVISRIRTGTQLGVVSLDVIEGDAHVCVVKRPNTIALERLDDNKRFVLECNPTADYTTAHHSIWNFRVLPCQRQVLVVRNITKDLHIVDMERDRVLIELYFLPGELSADGKPQPANATSLMTRNTTMDYFNVQISDVQHLMPFDKDESITPSLMERSPPRPLSLFFRTSKGFVHHFITPVAKKFPATTSSSSGQSSSSGSKRAPTQKHNIVYVYDVRKWKSTSFTIQAQRLPRKAEEIYEAQLDEEDRDGDASMKRPEYNPLRFLPGSRRAVIYEIPRSFRSMGPPITKCYGFQHYDRDATGLPNQVRTEEDEVEQALLESGNGAPLLPDVHPSLDIPARQMTRRTNIATMMMPLPVYRQIGRGVSAICFDEDTGRLVIASKEDGMLHVVDYSFTRLKNRDDDALAKMMDEAIEMEDQRMTE